MIISNIARSNNLPLRRALILVARKPGQNSMLHRLDDDDANYGRCVRCGRVKLLACGYCIDCDIDFTDNLT